jgi:hypothetical protein
MGGAMRAAHSANQSDSGDIVAPSRVEKATFEPTSSKAQRAYPDITR